MDDEKIPADSPEENKLADEGCCGGDSSCGCEGGGSRRTFLKGATAAVAGMAGLVAALSPLKDFEDNISMDEWLQQHYDELTPEKMAKVLERLEDETKRDFGVDVNIQDHKPMDGVEYAYALNLGRCIGCRKCVHACVAENNQSREPTTEYIRVLELEKGSINLEESNHYYDHDEVPADGKFYMPVQCHQCKNPPCVKVCPVKATWQEEDGITVVDYNWCIGCRYCEAACPYWARRFNFTTPEIAPKDINPEMAYLSNRIRPKGVMEKCTFCLQRTRQGKLPACLESCPTGARIFGNVLDPASPINYVLNNKRVFILKEDIGTIPRFYYFFDK